MQLNPEYRKKIIVGAILAVIMVGAVTTFSFWASPKTEQNVSTSTPASQSQLILELTDPPVGTFGNYFLESNLFADRSLCFRSSR